MKRRPLIAPPRVARELFATAAKWWSVDVEFARRMTRRQVHRLQLRFPIAYRGIYDVTVWPEGIFEQAWPEKWPGRVDAEQLIESLCSVGIPFRIRAAPFGRDCDAACELADRFTPPGRCRRDSNSGSCDPVWTVDDWSEIGGFHAAR